MKFTGLLNGRPLQHGAAYESPDEALESIRYIRENCPFDRSTTLSVKDNSTGKVTVVLPPQEKPR